MAKERLISHSREGDRQARPSMNRHYIIRSLSGMPYQLVMTYPDRSELVIAESSDLDLLCAAQDALQATKVE